MKDTLDIGAAGLGEAAVNLARRLQRLPLAPVWIACLMQCLDLPVFATALWFAQYGVLPDAGFRPWAAAGLAGAGALLAAGLITLSGGYASRVLCRAGRATLQAAPALLVAVLAGAVLLPAGVGAAFVASAVLALGLAVVPMRIGVAFVVRWVIETGLTERRAVIAGGGEHAARLIRGLAARPGNDIRLFGLFDDRDDLRSPIQVLGIPKIGDYSDLISFVRVSEIDLVIVALPLEAEERIKWLLDRFRILPVEVRLSAFSEDFAFPQPDRDPLISALRRSFAPERRLTKRLFDISIASLALLVLWPLMLAAAIAIRLDSRGPVIFRQRRHGYNDRIIEVLKFRSMYAEAADPAARRVVVRDDPRVTRVGRFLRRSSIDELPQLFNVLKGDLSLVGPRPHAVDALSSGQERFTQIVDGYSARHRLPPGITGWAQINGWRGEIDEAAKLRARVEHDLYYIENWSVWLDLRILLRTPLSLLNGRAAY